MYTVVLVLCNRCISYLPLWYGVEYICGTPARYLGIKEAVQLSRGYAYLCQLKTD